MPKNRGDFHRNPQKQPATTVQPVLLLLDRCYLLAVYAIQLQRQNLQVGSRWLLQSGFLPGGMRRLACVS